jgi:hypothetical protein
MLLCACTWNTNRVQPAMRDKLAATSNAMPGTSEALGVYVKKLPGVTYSLSESGSYPTGRLANAQFQRIGQITIASRDARGLTIDYFAQDGYCHSDGLALAPLDRAMNATFANIPRDLIPSGHIRLDLVARGQSYATTTHALRSGEWIELRFVKACDYDNMNYELVAITASLSHEITHAIAYVDNAVKEDTPESEDVADDAPACFFIALGADKQVDMFKGYSHEEWYYNSTEQPLHAMCRAWVAAMQALPRK